MKMKGKVKYTKCTAFISTCRHCPCVGVGICISLKQCDILEGGNTFINHNMDRVFVLITMLSYWFLFTLIQRWEEGGIGSAIQYESCWPFQFKVTIRILWKWWKNMMLVSLFVSAKGLIENEWKKLNETRFSFWYKMHFKHFSRFFCSFWVALAIINVKS